MRRSSHAEHDWEATKASVDLRVGGKMRVVMRDPRTGAEYGGGGRLREIDPPRRLAFTWLWDDNSTRMLIEIDFEEADGVTTVRFTHSGLWDERGGTLAQRRPEPRVRRPRPRARAHARDRP